MTRAPASGRTLRPWFSPGTGRQRGTRGAPCKRRSRDPRADEPEPLSDADQAFPRTLPGSAGELHRYAYPLSRVLTVWLKLRCLVQKQPSYRGESRLAAERVRVSNSLQIIALGRPCGPARSEEEGRVRPCACKGLGRGCLKSILRRTRSIGRSGQRADRPMTPIPSILSYSCLNAVTTGSRAARMAGSRPPASPIRIA